MWIKIAHFNDDGSTIETEFDCIGLETNYAYSPNDQNGYDQLIFTFINKVDFTLEDYCTSNYYIPSKAILVIREIDKPSLIPNLHNTLLKQFKRQLNKKFYPLKGWQAKRSTTDTELFIAEVEDIKSLLLYEDVMDELARDVMVYIKGENHGYAKEKNNTITLLLDDGNLKLKYEVEFNYIWDEYIEKVSNITIVKASKSTYTYPVDFNETDLYNLQKAINKFKV